MKLCCTWMNGAVARTVAVVASLLIAATAFTFTPSAPRQDGKDAAGDQANQVMPDGRVDAGKPADGGVAGGGSACGPGAGNCFTEGGYGTPGCDNVSCCETVCACDPFCCATQWDAFCAGEGFAGSGCGAELLCGGAPCPISFARSPGLAIPDNNSAGVTDFLDVFNSFTIDDINVRVNVTHTFIGDLCCTLTHEDSGISVILFQRMGDSLSDCHLGSPFGCGENNMNVILDSQSGAGSIENQCVANLVGSFTPEQSLAAFNGLNASSSWRLNIVDNAGGDLGTLDEWELIISGQPCGACPQDCVTSETFAPPADGKVDGADLAVLLGDWGTCPGCCTDTVSSDTFMPPADGVVDGADLAVLLGAWGEPGCD